MSVRDVVIYPDPRLKQVCHDVTDDVDLEVLAADLLDTMRSFPGCVGIAAPQIGEMFRAIAIDVAGHKKANSDHGELVLIDPIIVGSGIEKVEMREGCLSIPDFTGNVRRVAEVEVAATTPSGEPVRIACDAYEARVLLHELDHLDGILFLDRVASARDIFPRKRYK